MKKITLLVAALSLGMGAFAQSFGTVEVPIKKTGTVDGVDVSTDDAEQENDEMDKLFDDDLDAGWEGDDFNTLTTGLRFTDVQIPNGSYVDSAWIEIYAHEAEADPAEIIIWGEASDDAVTFDTNNLITDRPATSASVNWNVTEEWSIWTQYRTADISAIVEEIVNRPGWQAGNALSIILEGQDMGASALDNGRDFESFENEEDPDDGGDGLNHPERAPKLVVHYSPWPTSVADVKSKSTFKVYPNPANNNQITISSEALNQGEILDVQLFDLSGRLVLNTKASNGNVLNLNGVSTGVYSLAVTVNGNTTTQKIILQ